MTTTGEAFDEDSYSDRSHSGGNGKGNGKGNDGGNGNNNSSSAVDHKLVLHREELQMEGDEFETYCENHGLCALCGQTKVKKRGVFKLRKKNQWQPVTVRSKEYDNGENDGYIVYKGYCVQPGCFTLHQAQRLLGEIGPSRPVGDDAYFQPRQQEETSRHRRRNGGSGSGGGGGGGGGDSGRKKKQGLSRLLRGRPSSGNSSSGADGRPGGRKNSSSAVAFDSGFTGFSGSVNSSTAKNSSTAGSYSKSLRGSGRSGTRNSSSSGSMRSSSGRSISSEIRRADDDMSVGSVMTSESKVRSSLKQLLQDNMGTMLDLSSTRLHHVHITELVHSLSVARSLQTLILENCKLNDNEVEILGNGLASEDNEAKSLTRLSFRSNRIGNRGAASLQGFFSTTTTLEELDLSNNQIGSRGATSTLQAFRDNPHVKIKMINLAHNEIWDVDGDGSFFAKNKTLQLLNLEGNFIHDEGVEAIAKGLRSNPRQTQLSELYLGWNGIGDEGCIQIARLLETNKSLRKLGLGENDITSIGARALLSSLASNETLREITGLYHNQIDRKFVIASIKRLLYSHVEAIASEEDAQRRTEEMMEESLNAMDALTEPLGSHLPAPEETSESSLDWADKLFAPGEDAKPPVFEINAPGVPLGEINASVEDDGGTAVDDTAKLMLVAKDEENGVDAVHERQAEKKSSRFAEMPSPKFKMDRLTVFQAAPLAYFNGTTSLQQPFPLHDFDHEIAVIQHAIEGAAKLDAIIELDVEPATAESFRAFLEGGTSGVLHFSCFGHSKQVLALENAEGSLDDSIDFDGLRGIVEKAKTPLQLVVVNSFYSGRIGKAFVDAGVPHVICCHHTEIHRDKASYSFLKNLYRGLAVNKSIKQAFYHARESVRVEEITKHVERYVLLPRQPEEDSYHDVPLFYTNLVPATGMTNETDKQALEEGRTILPQGSRHFIGRELDMCSILEALKIDDVVRVGGVKGSGKTSVVAATCRYVQKRPKSFQYDDVFWLPPGKGVVPTADTLFGDLAEFVGRMVKADGDIFNDEVSMECRERIEIELEGRRTLLAIDCRKFVGETATSNLEQFLGNLLESDLSVKIILISADAAAHDDDDEDDTIRLGPIDFKSTALLFGEISRFIAANGCPAAQSPDEFAALIVPPSVALLQDRTKVSSSRQTRLMSQIGNGVPLEIIRAGKSMPASVFIHLIGMANTPEVRVDSFNSLDAAMKKWSSQLEKSVDGKNFLRALDLDHVVKELRSLRKQFPSLDDLIAEEEELHRRHTTCFKNRQYEEGNRLKREILALKKRILQEKRSASSNHTTITATPDKMSNLQEQMNSIMKMANSSFSSETELPLPDQTKAVFVLGSDYHNCEVRIYPGNVCDFDPQNNDLGAVVCWTNESCDLNLDQSGRTLLEFGGRLLDKDISSLPGITKTPWGVAKCGIGNAVIVGPGNYDDLSVHCVILAVGPMSAACDDQFEAKDEDSLHYVKVMMRSCIRSSLILAKHSQVQSIAFPTLTSEVDGPAYERTLLTNLKILFEEAKHSDLLTLHIVARSDEESSKLIGMAQELGLVMSG